MNISYISLGSFCYPKMIIRETNREIKESLPFDFHSSPHLDGITNILKELYEKGTYELDLIEILEIYNENELSIREKNMYVVHFFKTDDLIKEIKTFPASVTEHVNSDKILEIKNLFKKRFERLYNILNNKDNILCFLRIENYDNWGWETELIGFTDILSKFKNPNKFLIYSQNVIDENLHFDKSRMLNYKYHIPIFFFKYYFYDLEMINNKDLFISILNTFEYILENNVLNIEYNEIIEKYYYDKDKYQLFKLTNLNLFSNAFLENNETLYIINSLEGNYKFTKNENNIYKFECILKSA